MKKKSLIDGGNRMRKREQEEGLANVGRKVAPGEEMNDNTRSRDPGLQRYWIPAILFRLGWRAQMSCLGVAVAEK